MLDGWVNVDRWPVGLAIDRGELAKMGEFQSWNLNMPPWPWADESVDAIEARDVFEHVDDAILFMSECWRILQTSKYLHIHTPHYKCIDAYTDPTHKRFPTEHTFDYWIPGTVLYQHHNATYGGARFELVDLTPDNGSMDVTLRRLAR